MRRTNSSGILRYKQITHSRSEDHSYEGQQQKNRSCQIVDFAAPAEHRMKMKKEEKFKREIST